MGYQSANVEEIYLAPGSAVFPSTGTGAFGLGYADEAKFEITPFGDIKQKSNRVFPSLVNFKASKKTEQMSAAFFKFLVSAFTVNDVTVKIITSGITKATDFTATGGIFTFENAESMGLDWELVLSPKERYLLITVEKAYKQVDALTILSGAAASTLSGSLSVPSLDAVNTVKAYISPSFGSISIADDRLDDWKISIKTRTNKTAFNKSRGKYIDVNIMGVLDGADPTEIGTYLTSGFAPDLTIAVGVDTPYNIVLKAGGLTQMGSASIDEDKRTATVNFTGSYPVEFADTSGTGVTFQAKL